MLHFYGIHPDKPAELTAAMLVKALTPSPQLRSLRVRCHTLIPRNNAEFLAAAGAR